MLGKFPIFTLLIVSLALLAGCGHKSDQSGAAGGQATPEASVAIPTLDDMSASINQYKGKVVLVNFWATWCEPCQKEIPWLIKLNDQYGSRGLVILGISMDDDGKKAVDPFVKDKRFKVDGKDEPMDYPILLGSDAISDKFGGLMGLPTSMLYARDGRKVKTIIGAVNSYADLSSAVEKQL